MERTVNPSFYTFYVVVLQSVFTFFTYKMGHQGKLTLLQLWHMTRVFHKEWLLGFKYKIPSIYIDLRHLYDYLWTITLFLHFARIVFLWNMASAPDIRWKLLLFFLHLLVWNLHLKTLSSLWGLGDRYPLIPRGNRTPTLPTNVQNGGFGAKW